MLNSITKKKLIRWCEAGKILHQKFKNSGYLQGDPKDFYCALYKYLFVNFRIVFQFAGQCTSTQILEQSYDILYQKTQRSPDSYFKNVMFEFVSVGRELFVDGRKDLPLIWEYLRENNLLPGMADVERWLKLASDIKRDYSNQLKRDGVYLDFLYIYNRGGLGDFYDFGCDSSTPIESLHESLKQAENKCSRLNGWAKRLPHSILRSKMLMYLTYWKLLFCSDEYEPFVVHFYMIQNGICPDLAVELNKYKKEKREVSSRGLCEKDKDKKLNGIRGDVKKGETKSAQINYSKSTYRSGKNQSENKRDSKKRTRRIIWIVVLCAIVLPKMMLSLYSLYVEKVKCHTTEVMQNPIFTTDEYDKQLAFLDSVLLTIKRQKCKDELLVYYIDIESLNEIVDTLHYQFAKPKRGRALVEKSIRSKNMDEIRRIDSLISKGEYLAPNDESIKRFRKDFDNWKKKYKIPDQ